MVLRATRDRWAKAWMFPCYTLQFYFKQILLIYIHKKKNIPSQIQPSLFDYRTPVPNLRACHGRPWSETRGEVHPACKKSLLILKATEIIISLWTWVFEQLFKRPARPRNSLSVPMTTAESRMASGSCKKVLWNCHFLTRIKKIRLATLAENTIFMLNLMLTSYR